MCVCVLHGIVCACMCGLCSVCVHVCVCMCVWWVYVRVVHTRVHVCNASGGGSGILLFYLQLNSKNNKTRASAWMQIDIYWASTDQTPLKVNLRLGHSLFLPHPP